MKPPADPVVIEAVSVVVRRGGRFLLVRRLRPPAQGLYAFPGGRVEPGETLAEAARRELLEETGLRAIGALATVASIDIEPEAPGDSAFRLTVLSAAGAVGEAVPADDAEQAGWYTIEEMQAMPLTGSVLEVAKSLAGVA